MQENHLFEYAIVRVVPKVEREEFINVGVILYCPSKKFLGCLFTLNESKLNMMNCQLDMEELKQHLNAFEKICAGDKAGGPIARLDLPSRFRWLTAIRSTVLQSSKVHPGLSPDPVRMLDHLHKQLVL